MSKKMKAITLSWDEAEALVNQGTEIFQIFQECVVQTCSRQGDGGNVFWTENQYRYRILYYE